MWFRKQKVCRLGVQVVVVVVRGGRRRRGRCAAPVVGGPGEPEVGAESPALLKILRKRLVLSDVGIADGAPGKLHGLLKVGLGDGRDGVRGVLLHLVRVVGGPAFLLDIPLNGLPDSVFACTLADFRDVGTGEALGDLGKVVEVHVEGHRRLPQRRLEDLLPGRLVREGDVYQLIQSPRAHQRRVDDVRPVGGTDDEDRLLRAHAVHFRQELVQHSVSRAASVSRAVSPLDGNGIQLIEKEHARGGLTRLVENIPHVGLRFSEPHGQELRTFDGDKVGLALVGDCLGQKRLPASRGPIEEHAL
mmetsp:Transcript_8630/g.23422  ORF Transcript_8630/g.23422 Transcript_8630/m.23422 type:complete len:303 (-) Transcript_8630:1626-2534(-)